MHVTTSMKFHFPICRKALLVPAYMLLMSDLISKYEQNVINKHVFSSLLTQQIYNAVHYTDLDIGQI